MPGYYWPHAVLAAVYGQLGERERGERRRCGSCTRCCPTSARSAREEFGSGATTRSSSSTCWTACARRGWRFRDESAKLRAAGASPASTTDSGAARADEGFWVAVLPFKYGGTDASSSRLWRRD